MVAQNQAHYPAIKPLTVFDTCHCTACTMDHHFCTVMQMSRQPFGGMTAWVESYSVEQHVCAVKLGVYWKMPQNISESLPTKHSIYKLVSKLKTTVSLLA
jgi:hypothetical protein